MQLLISNKVDKYLPEITTDKNFYYFTFVRPNYYFEKEDTKSFKKFRCSINCRLQHYKDFKKQLFLYDDYNGQTYKKI